MIFNILRLYNKFKKSTQNKIWLFLYHRLGWRFKHGGHKDKNTEIPEILLGLTEQKDFVASVLTSADSVFK